MVIIDGHDIAEKWLQRLARDFAVPATLCGLAAFSIGATDELKKFIQLKKKAAEKLGIQFSSYEFDDSLSREEVISTMKWLAQDQETNGMLVELPIPPAWNTSELLNLIPIGKDVDVLSDEAQELYYSNRSFILPPAVRALKELVDVAQIRVPGTTVAVFGQGMLVGKPIAHWCEVQGANVYRIDETTLEPESLARQAGIIITGVGKPELITGDMIKDDAIVIDFGYGRKGSEMVGDVELSSVSKKAQLITPVPGGMGPLVVVAVLENLLKLSNK